MKRFALLSLLIIPLSVIAAKRAEAPGLTQIPGPVQFNSQVTFDHYTSFAGWVFGSTSFWTGDVSVDGELAVGGPVYFSRPLTVGADSSADPSAILDIQSARGGIGNASMTRLQRLAIQSPRDGLQVYQTDGVTGIYLRDAGVWKRLSAVAAP